MSTTPKARRQTPSRRPISPVKAQAHAAMAGREFALPEDLRAVAVPVLAHRVTAGAGVKRADAEARLQMLVDQIPVPLENRP